jgi:hypothetical protein
MCCKQSHGFRLHVFLQFQNQWESKFRDNVIGMPMPSFLLLARQSLRPLLPSQGSGTIIPLVSFVELLWSQTLEEQAASEREQHAAPPFATSTLIMHC